jgi:hypothetical protein
MAGRNKGFTGIELFQGARKALVNILEDIGIPYN